MLSWQGCVVRGSRCNAGQPVSSLGVDVDRDERREGEKRYPSASDSTKSSYWADIVTRIFTQQVLEYE